MAMINNSKEITRGDTALFSITLYGVDGEEYIPTTGEVVTFYLLKKNCDDLDSALLTKEIDIEAMQLELTPAETKALDTGTYAYRVRIRDILGREYTVIKSTLKVIC